MLSTSTAVILRSPSHRPAGLALIAIAVIALSVLWGLPSPPAAQAQSRGQDQLQPTQPADARVQREQMIAELKQLNLHMRQAIELLREVRDASSKANDKK